MKFSQPPRRLDRIFADAPLYFVTVCTYRKRAKLANDALHDAFISFTESAATDFNIAVGRYVIMPDHLHLFVAGPNDFDLGKWIGTAKRILARALPRSDSDDPIWQRGFFDHLLRSDESCAQKWEYVRENSGAGRPRQRLERVALRGRNRLNRSLVDASLCEARVSAWIGPEPFQFHPQTRASQREASTSAPA
ncbi:MAG: transposase [Chthoniobacterales bacterium]|nr:transposase [Chthoniobacterales bacterium]